MDNTSTGAGGVSKRGLCFLPESLQIQTYLAYKHRLSLPPDAFRRLVKILVLTLMVLVQTQRCKWAETPLERGPASDSCVFSSVTSCADLRLTRPPVDWPFSL